SARRPYFRARSVAPHGRSGEHLHVDASSRGIARSWHAVGHDSYSGAIQESLGRAGFDDVVPHYSNWLSSGGALGGRAARLGGNRQRTLQAESPFVIRGADVPWETNPQGIIKWYLHPAMERSCHKALIFSVQKIPPESRSGKQHCQGGVVQYVVQGKGRTVMNEISHPWEAGDVVQLPLLPEGVTFQHFNE